MVRRLPPPIGDREQPRVSLTLTLASPPPAGVVGVIVFSADAPLLYAPTERGATTQLVWSSGGFCPAKKPGDPPLQGDYVRVAWVDAEGRVSARSNPIQVELRK
jgi:hypothetical protein